MFSLYEFFDSTARKWPWIYHNILTITVVVLKLECAWESSVEHLCIDAWDTEVWTQQMWEHLGILIPTQQVFGLQFRGTSICAKEAFYVF